MGWNLSVSALFRSLDLKEQHELVVEMDKFGHACIDNFITAKQLQELRDYVSAQAQLHQGRYFAHHGSAALGGTLLGSLGGEPHFLRMLADIHRQGTGRDAYRQTVQTVLRCVQGRSGRHESNCFHYDASLLTALLPLDIPTEGQARGDLLLFPNSRRVRSSVLANVIEKAMLQNRLTRWLICLAIRRRWLAPQRLTLVPGNLYLFWGYRSLHANEPCDPAQRRATAIFHYGDPHAGSLATRLILSLNQRRARRATAAAAAQHAA